VKLAVFPTAETKDFGRQKEPRRVENAGAVGHDCGAVQDGLPDEQVLCGSRPGAQGADPQADPGGVSDRPGCAQRGGGPGAAVHLLPERL